MVSLFCVGESNHGAGKVSGWAHPPVRYPGNRELGAGRPAQLSQAHAVVLQAPCGPCWVAHHSGSGLCAVVTGVPGTAATHSR